MVGPNDSFLSYIADVLPVEELYAESIATVHPSHYDPAAARLAHQRTMELFGRALG